MAIRKFRTGQMAYNAATYVGTYGTIFYNEDTGNLRISDGTTPGGNPLTLVASDFNFAFGDFVALTPGNGAATLRSKNINQDINLVSNGTGVINMVGDFHIHRTADYDPNLNDPNTAVFAVKADGQIQMKVPLADSTTAALEIVGNDSGVFFPPTQTGVILHVTGNSGLVSRNYFDANQNYALLVGRRYNGTQSDPSKVLSGEMFFRIAGQASTDSGFETFGPCQIDWVATEDQTPTAQGGELRFRATPNGANAQTGGIIVATINATTGLTATKFNGPLTGNVTGNVSGTAGSVAAANLTGTTLASNVVTSSLTSVGTLGSLTVTNDVYAGNLHGKLYRPVRDAGTIAAGGTLTIDFTADSIVHCVWGDGLNIAYQNYVAGRIVKVMAVKSAGTGTDSISLDGVTAGQVSTGATTVTANAGATVFIEFISTTTAVGGVFVKL